MAICLQRLLRTWQGLNHGGDLALRALSTSHFLQMKRPKFEGPLPDFKRPPNQYGLFLQECSRTEPLDMKTCAQKWKAMTDQEKLKYKVLYSQRMAEYKIQYEDFLKKKVGGKKKQEAYHAAMKDHKAKMKEYIRDFRLKKKDLLKPRKMSGYVLFVKDVFAESPVQSKEDSQALISTVAQKWKEAGEAERHRYKAMAETLHKERMKDYEKRFKEAVKQGLVPKPDNDKKGKKAESKKVEKSKKAPKKTTKSTSLAEATEDKGDLFASDDEGTLQSGTESDGASHTSDDEAVEEEVIEEGEIPKGWVEAKGRS